MAFGQHVTPFRSSTADTSLRCMMPPIDQAKQFPCEATVDCVAIEIPHREIPRPPPMLGDVDLTPPNAEDGVSEGAVIPGRHYHPPTAFT